MIILESSIPRVKEIFPRFADLVQLSGGEEAG
jgi:hypothetical protein